MQYNHFKMFDYLLQTIGSPLLILTGAYVALTAAVIYTHPFEKHLKLCANYREILDELRDISNCHNLNSVDYWRSRKYSYFNNSSSFKECANGMYRNLMLFYISKIYTANRENTQREIDFVKNNTPLMLAALSSENIRLKNTLCTKLYELYISYEDLPINEDIALSYSYLDAVCKQSFKTEHNKCFCNACYELSDDEMESDSSSESDSSEESSDDSSVESNDSNNKEQLEENETMVLSDSSTSQQSSIELKSADEPASNNLSESQLFSPRKLLPGVPAQNIAQAVLDTPQLE